MPKRPPERPQKGKPIPHDWFGDFYDYVRSLEVRGDLATTTVSRDRTGTVVRAPFATNAGDGVAPPSNRAMFAKITVDNADGTYEGELQQNASGTFSNAATRTITFDSGNSGYLYELNGRAGVPINTIVQVIRGSDTNGGIIWYFIAPQANLFPVDLTQTGGSAGNATTTCTFTYTVKVGTVTLGTSKSPTFARPAKGKMVAATKGTAYYDTSAALVLYQVDEVPDVQAC